MRTSTLDRILYLIAALGAVGILVCLALDASAPTTSYAAGRDVVTTSVTAGHHRSRADLLDPRLGVANDHHTPYTPAGSDSNGT